MLSSESKTAIPIKLNLSETTRKDNLHRVEQAQAQETRRQRQTEQNQGEPRSRDEKGWKHKTARSRKSQVKDRRMERWKARPIASCQYVGFCDWFCFRLFFSPVSFSLSASRSLCLFFSLFLLGLKRCWYLLLEGRGIGWC